MGATTIYKRISKPESGKDIETIEQIKKKAAFWDEFVEFIEDKFFGNLMELTEQEKNISLSRAKKLLR